MDEDFDTSSQAAAHRPASEASAEPTSDTSSRLLRAATAAFEARLDRWSDGVQAAMLLAHGLDPEAPPELPKSLPSRPELLRYLAARLLAEAETAVPGVIAGDVGDAPHPLGHFVEAQLREQGQDPADWRAEQFQLPEPLLGPIGDETLVVTVGLNPAYSAEEEIPRLGTSLDDYVAWYAQRFSSRGRRDDGMPLARFPDEARPVSHYRAIERDILEPVLGKHTLGRVAVHADAIPWKWNRPHPRFTSDVVRYAQERVALIATVLQPRVVITLGAFAADSLRLPRPSREPKLVVGVGVWPGQCLPLFHPNRRWGPGEKPAYFEAAQNLLHEVFS